MKRIRTCLLSIMLMSLFVSVASSRMAPDLVIINGKVRTMNPDQPAAEAVAIFGERVVTVGTDQEVRELADARTRVIDAGGRLVLPGFNDAHVHFLSGGFALSSVNLREARTPEELTRRIAEYARKLPLGKWVTGGEWDHESWPGAPLPTRDWIDGVTPDRPVFVSRLDGHMALANSRALKLAGIDKDTQSPPGGLIVRDPKTGEPTGLLKDAAMGLVSRHIAEPQFAEKLAAAQAASEHAATLGVTSVQDMSAGDDVGVYQELMREGSLKTRIYAVWPLPQWHALFRTGVRAGFGNVWLRTGGLKGFSDGSLGSTTALFFEPYVDAPETRGLPADEMFPEGAMRDRIMGADRAGLQVMVHAIGDKANAEMLTMFEQVAKANGPHDRRFRIEHAQHLRASDIPRFNAGKVVASMQPYHAADDGRWAEKRIGNERCRGTYAFRSLLDAGATLAFGSDWTVAPLDPLKGIAAAVTRRTLDGKNPGGWVPEEKISVEEAVRAYTVGSARAEFTDHEKGQLAPGKLADLVVLSRDLFTIKPEEIDGTQVLLTIVGGRVVHDALR